MTNNIEIEKSIPEQIIDRMIEKLKGTEDFDEIILAELKGADLTHKNDVKKIISKATEVAQNEDTETGD